MKKQLLVLALAAACVSREPVDPAPMAPSPGASRGEPAGSGEGADAVEEGDTVAAELTRIHGEQLLLESEMAGLRQEPDDVAWVKKKLANMVAKDQLLRNAMMIPSEKEWDADAVRAFMSDIGPRTIVVDERNTEELKALVERHGWFNISTFGAEADRNAWLLVQHADRDPAFQKEILTVLEELVPLGETSPSNFAYLYDRVATAEGRPQRYGTQGRCVGTSWEPHPLEDPEGVDELRASVGLSTLAAYRELCSQMCR